MFSQDAELKLLPNRGKIYAQTLEESFIISLPPPPPPAAGGDGDGGVGFSSPN